MKDLIIFISTSITLNNICAYRQGVIAGSTKGLLATFFSLTALGSIHLLLKKDGMMPIHVWDPMLCTFGLAMNTRYKPKTFITGSKVCMGTNRHILGGQNGNQ
jgi:hypothetical protein